MLELITPLKIDEMIIHLSLINHTVLYISQVMLDSLSSKYGVEASLLIRQNSMKIPTLTGQRSCELSSVFDYLVVC